MKVSLLVLSLFAISSFSFANIEHDDHEGHNHNPDAVEETLYFSNNSTNELRDNAFEYLVYDSQNDRQIVSPLGDTKFPYSALGQIEKVMSAGASTIVFQMSKVQASFAENQHEIDGAFREGQFYAAETSMIFLADDGYTITTIDNASFVIIPEFVTKDLEQLLDIKWNECHNQHFRGNYDDGNLTLRCSKNRMMHDGFRGLLERNLLSCVNESLKSIGRATSPDVYLVHKGTAADKLHSSGSMHQQGKAIDIRIVRVTGTDGKKYDIDYARAVRGNPGWRKRFYQSFRTCWGKVQLTRSSQCVSNNMRYNRANNLPYYGSIGWEDSKHRVHMHISMPPCGTRRI